MDTYSIYEAKSRFSEVIRRVREGRTVTVTYRGDPVAVIRSIEEESGSLVGARIGELRRRGEIVSPADQGRPSPVAHRPGALQRFLDDRGE